jgi:hypothetical protein
VDREFWRLPAGSQVVPRSVWHLKPRLGIMFRPIH